MGSSVPQDISNSLWAFATMRHYPGAPLLDAAAARAARGEGMQVSSAPVPLVRKLSAALSRGASPSKAIAVAVSPKSSNHNTTTNPASSSPRSFDRRSSGSFGRAVSAGPAAYANNTSNLLLSTPTTFVNTSTVRDEPLIFHAATSVANPTRYGWLLMHTIVPFFFDNPPRHRFYQGDYISIHRWSSFMPDNTLVFKLFVAFYTLKFLLISWLMRLKGLPKLADTVWNGWQAYNLYNSSRLDFQLFFCVRNAAKLQKMLDATESLDAGDKSDVQQLGCGTCAATTDAAATPVVWHGEWFDYINRHCEVVNARFFSDAAVAAATAGSGSKPKAAAASAKKADGEPGGKIAAAEGEASGSATGAQLLSSSTAAKLVSTKAATAKPAAAPGVVPLSLIPKPKGPPSLASIAKATAYLRERAGEEAYEATTVGSTQRARAQRAASGGSGLGSGSPLASSSPSPPSTPNGKAGGFEGGERAPLLGARSR